MCGMLYFRKLLQKNLLFTVFLHFGFLVLFPTNILLFAVPLTPIAGYCLPEVFIKNAYYSATFLSKYTQIYCRTQSFDYLCC